MARIGRFVAGAMRQTGPNLATPLLPPRSPLLCSNLSIQITEAESRFSRFLPLLTSVTRSWPFVIYLMRIQGASILATLLLHLLCLAKAGMKLVGARDASVPGNDSDFFTRKSLLTAPEIESKPGRHD